MTRLRLIILVLILAGLSGCTASQVLPPPVVPSVKLLKEDMGWVQVNVTGVSNPGYTLKWGDVETVYGVSTVIPKQEKYEHMYQNPGNYTISLVAPDKKIVAQATVSVFHVDCHVSLLAVNGRTIIIRYFGRYGINYALSWGDHYGETIVAATGTGILSHTYSVPGEYAVSMGETWAPPRTFFTVTIK